MKLNISYPATGCQKLIEVDDEKKLRVFYEKRIATEVSADSLGDEWKGYIVRISGGNDKQGFPMKQGVLTTGRVRLLLSKGHSCYRPRRDGERRRKSVRGCIVDGNLSVLNLVIVKKGEAEIPNITDTTIPRRLGPKRASKIRKLFNLSKEDDVRRYVIKRPMPPKEGKKPKTKSPKIQRLVTPRVLAHKRRRIALKLLRRQKSKEAAAEYAKLLAMRAKEARQKRAELFKRRRYRTASLRESQSKQEGGTSDSLKEGGTKELTKKEFKRELLKKKLAANKKSMEKKRKGKKDMIDIRALKARSYSGAWRGINVERIGRGYLPIKGRSRFGIKLSKKAIAKRLSGKKELAKKKSLKKPSDGKHPGGKRPDSKKPEGKKSAGKRPEGKRPADKKAEGKRPESKKSEGKQSAGKRPEGKKLEGKRPDSKKAEGKRSEGKKAEGKKPEGKKPEVKKPEGKKKEVKKSESKQSDGKRPEVKHPESKKSDAKRPEGKHPAPASKEIAAKKAKKDIPKTSAKKTEKPKK